MTNKSRILCLLEILYKYTDKEHPLSTNDLEKYLENKYGLSIHRITLKKNIQKLVGMGYNIVEIRSTQNMYFLDKRIFELSEIELLIDAIEKSEAISETHSKILISKICTFNSQFQNNKLNYERYMSDEERK